MMACAIGALCAVLVAQQDVRNDYEPTWESLETHPTPEWFEDGKFGIFIHWGVYSVPSFCDTSTYSEWYQAWLDGNTHNGIVRDFHAANYGEDFEYHEFAPMFRAEMWDPVEWARLEAVLARLGPPAAGEARLLPPPRHSFALTASKSKPTS